MHALRSVSRAEGVRGLTAGLLPTLLRDVPFSGLYLMFYEQLKRVATASLVSFSTPRTSAVAAATAAVDFSGWLHFGCGLAAGVLASLVTQPADVVKTRLQLAKARVAQI